jgi:hypothetical protein
MKTEIISFFSDIDGTSYYSDHAFRLREECFKHNVPYDFRHMESTGDYRLNCLRKPQFILSLLEEKKKPLVWMDIDSIIHKELLAFDHLSENNADIGFAYPITKPDQINMSSPKASPIFCNYNEKVIKFLQTWIANCEESLKNGEHFFDHEILLMRVLPKVKEIKIGILPINYCVWPNKCPKGIDPYITMGIADGKSKEKNLRELAKVLNMSEHHILFNLNKV